MSYKSLNNNVEIKILTNWLNIKSEMRKNFQSQSSEPSA